MLLLLRILMWLSGISFFTWAHADPRFRDAEGFLSGGYCLPVVVGVAFIVVGAAVTGRMRRSAFWFSLALVGQAVALQLIEAGPFIRYQHYIIYDFSQQAEDFFCHIGNSHAVTDGIAIYNCWLVLLDAFKK